jgi:hypothetical protein
MRALVGSAIFHRQRNGSPLPSACRRIFEKCLTPPTLSDRRFIISESRCRDDMHVHLRQASNAIMTLCYWPSRARATDLKRRIGVVPRPTHNLSRCAVLGASAAFVRLHTPRYGRIICGAMDFVLLQYTPPREDSVLSSEATGHEKTVLLTA